MMVMRPLKGSSNIYLGSVGRESVPNNSGNGKSTLNQFLPDVSKNDAPAVAIPLNWVGMESIDVPIQVQESGQTLNLHAKACAFVDLPDPTVKGIHMSRLYLIVDELGERGALTPELLGDALKRMIDSHEDCSTASARLGLNFDLLIKRPALKTEGLSGWKSYPVELVAVLVGGKLSINAKVSVVYSSTCPCSAALSREIIKEAFTDAFADSEHISLEAAQAWITKNASLATPHSQRSTAEISVAMTDEINLTRLIDMAEASLATPVQTAVKRLDEQAFAELNGHNLMFVEDASRRLLMTLKANYKNARVHVRHFESLHPHDAVAISG